MTRAAEAPAYDKDDANERDECEYYIEAWNFLAYQDLREQYGHYWRQVACNSLEDEREELDDGQVGNLDGRC